MAPRWKMKYNSWDEYDKTADILSWVSEYHKVKKVPKKEKDVYEERIKSLEDVVQHYKQELEAATVEKKSAQRKLKLFLKAITKFISLDTLKIEIKELIQREKDHIKISKFFGSQTKQLKDFEDSLDDIDFDK